MDIIPTKLALPMTVREYARIQAAYVATLGPWITTWAEHTVARDAYEKALRAQKPRVTGDSHTARNRSLVARNLVESRIAAAHKVWRAAEARWKAAKKARFEALRDEWRAGRALASVKAARRRLAALKATEPGARDATCEPRDGNLWVAMLEFTDGRESLVVEDPTYVGAISGLMVAAHREDLLKVS